VSDEFNSPREAADRLVAAYEDLRRAMIGERASQAWGMTLFIRQGMRAWMDAYGQSHTANPKRPLSAEAGEGIAPDRLQLTHMLVDMAQVRFLQGGI